MATPTKTHRKGGDLAFIEDGNQGNPALAVRDRSIGAGHTQDSGDTSKVKWGVVTEPLTFTHNVAGGVLASASETVKHTFKRRRPEKRRFSITAPINGSVDSSEGVVAFNCPADRAFKIVRVTETHTVLEATAGECNIQVAIVPDGDTLTSSGLRRACTPNEIDVETGGIAVNVTTEARLEKGAPTRVSGSVTIDGTINDQGGTLYNVPTGKSYKVTRLSASWDAPSDSATSHTLIFKKCTVGQDPSGAGTSLHSSGTLNLKGADDTVFNVGLTGTNSTKAIAAGERICYFCDETGANSTEILLTLSWELEETTAGITGAGDLVVHPNERVMVFFQTDSGQSLQDTTEYRGNVTVTLEEVEAELHQEKIITVNLSDADNLAATGLCVFEASEHPWRVKSIEESHAVVDDGTAPKLIAERSQGTEAVGAGDDIIGVTDIALDATINTVQSGTIVSSGVEVLEEGDRLLLSMDDSGASALGTYDGVITIVLAPELSTPSTARVVSTPLEKAILITGSDIFIADQDYRLLGVSFTPVIIETSVAAPSIQLEKLSDGQAVAGGTLLLAAQALDADATVDTIQHVVPTAANAIITNGQRIALYGTDDGASDAAVALTEFRGGITLFLEPINDARGTLESAFIYTNDTGGVMAVTDVSAIWENVETHAITLNVQFERLQGTEVLGAGDKLIGDTNIDVVNGAKNTRFAGTVVTSGVEDLAVNDRLGVYFVNDAGTRVNPGDLDGLEVTVRLTAQAASGSPAAEGALFTNGTGRPVELRDLAASWDVPETTAATLNLIVERLTVNEAGGAGNGDRLCGLTDINVKGADDTAGKITPVTTISVRAAVLSTGSGSDDATSGGTFVAPAGFSGRTVFTFTVDSTGSTDTITVRRDGRVLQRKLDMSTSAITIVGGDGVTILWASATSHTLADVWTVVVSRNTILEDGDRLGYFFDVDAGGTVTVPTELEGLNIVPRLVPTELAVASTT